MEKGETTWVTPYQQPGQSVGAIQDVEETWSVLYQGGIQGWLHHIPDAADEVVGGHATHGWAGQRLAERKTEQSLHKL